MQQGKVFQIQCHIYSLLIKNPSIRSPVRLSTHIWKPTGEKRWWRTLKTWLSPSLVIRWSSVKDPLSFFPFNRNKNVLISSFNSPLSLSRVFSSYWLVYLHRNTLLYIAKVKQKWLLHGHFLEVKALLHSWILHIKRILWFQGHVASFNQASILFPVLFFFFFFNSTSL